MKIIEPSVELWMQEDPIAHVARCARICYGRDSGNDFVLCNNLLHNKHWSMFRHESVYAIIPEKDTHDLWHAVMNGYMNCPYIDWICFEHKYYISTNGNFLLDIKKYNSILYKWLTQYRADALTFNNIHPLVSNLMRYTFKVTTQISTSRELNRVSPNNIAERSTRYVYEDGTICRPHWMTINEANEFNNNHQAGMTTIGRNYINSCIQSFGTYKDLIEINGLNRQDARGVLPLDTATVCAYTYSVKEWRAILDLRYYGTTGKPHSNAKLIAGMIRNELIELGYEFR